MSPPGTLGVPDAHRNAGKSWASRCAIALQKVPGNENLKEVIAEIDESKFEKMKYAKGSHVKRQWV